MPMPVTPSFTQRICGWILRICGWTVVFRWPPAPKCVVIFYPHTSNWDFVWGGLAFIDHPSKRIGVDTYIAMSGKEEDDLASFRAYYSGKRGVHPELQGDICFVRRDGRAADSH